MKLKSKRVVIFAENFYEDLELWYPYYRLKEEGAEVVVAGPRQDTFKSKHGYPVTPDTLITEIKPDQFDAVIIPGGYAPDHMRRKPEMVSFVQDAGKKGKVIAAICHAGWMLASTDLIKGKKVTGFFSIKDDLVNAGATYEDKAVVVDGNIITSRTPKDLPQFMGAIINALS